MKARRANHPILIATAVCMGLVALPGSLPGNASRAESGGTPGGIVITVAPPAGTSAYGVEEALPFGVYPSSISHEGVFDRHTSKVKWGPFPDDQVRELTLEIRGTEGALNLAGSVSYDATGSIAIAGISEATLPGLDTYFEGWQSRHLDLNLSTFSGRHVISGATLPLLAQYAMGVHPEAGGSPFAIVSGPSGPEIRYVRDTRRNDVTIKVENSGDLTAWSPLEVSGPQTGMLDQHREEIRISADEDTFYRLRFIRVP